MHALAGVIDGQSKPAPDLLVLLIGGLRLVLRANLKEIWIYQFGLGENIYSGILTVTVIMNT